MPNLFCPPKLNGKCLFLITTFLIQLLIFFPIHAQTNDAGIVGSSISFMDANDDYTEIPISLYLKNFGSTDLFSCDIKWMVKGLNDLYYVDGYEWSDTLKPNEIIKVDVGTIDLFPYDIYRIIAWSDNPNGEEDENHDNDSLSSYPNTVPAPEKHDCLELDGEDDYVEIGGDTDIISNGVPGEYTIDMWINLDEKKESFVFGDEHSFNNGIMMQFNSEGYYQTFYNHTYYTSEFKPQAGKWYHISQVQNSTGIHLYVYGKFFQTLVSNGAHNDTDDPYKIGAFYIDEVHDRFFDGDIDNIRIWDRDISANLPEELFEYDYSDGKEGLVAFWDFKYDEYLMPDRTSFTINKYGPNAYDGTLVNGALLHASSSPVPDWEYYYLDVRVEEIISPYLESCQYSDQEKVVVVVQNFGDMDLSGLDIGYVLEGTTDTIIENLGSRIIPATDTIHYTFETPIDFSNPEEEHNILAFINLPGDYGTENNYNYQEFHTVGFPDIEIHGDSVFCSQNSIKLQAWACTEDVIWSNGLHGYDIWVSPDETTTYYATASDTLGSGEICSATDTFTVQVADPLDVLPEIDYDGSTTVCYGEEVILSSNISSEEEALYLWSNGETGHEISVTQSGVCFYQYQSPGGCVAYSDTIEITVLPRVHISASVTEPVCSGNNVDLTVHNATNFRWSTGEKSEKITVSPAYTNTYFVTDTNSFGCIYIDSITIEVYPKTILKITGDTALCQGDESVLQAVSSATGSFEWNTGQSGSQITVQPSADRIYRVLHTDNHDCQTTDSIFIKVNSYYQRPWIISHGNTSVCKGEQVTLQAPDMDIIVWSTGNTGSEAIFTEDADVYVMIVPESNCISYSDTVQVRFYDKPALSNDVVPAFCAGDSIELEVINATSVNWSTGNTETTIKVAPEETTTYSYSAMNTSWCQTDDSVRLELIPIEYIPQPVQNMMPSEGSVMPKSEVELSWLPDTSATSYDIFIWYSDSLKPEIPFAKDIRSISYKAKLAYGQSYNWQVVSKTPCQEVEGQIQSFSTAPKPDLQVGEIACSDAYAGRTFEVTWTITNAGKGRADAHRWKDRVWLSQENTDVRIGEKEDILLGEFDNVRVLDTADSYQNTKTVKIPYDVSGAYYLFVITDDLDALNINLETMESSYTHSGNMVDVLDETNERNNLNFIPLQINIPPPPDLQVTSVQVPAIGTFFSGQTIDMKWQISNLGTAPTQTDRWSDVIYLSSTPYLSIESYHVELKTFTHRGLLEADSSSLHTTTVQFPEGIQGNFYLIVKTDAKNEVYEYAYENNNSFASDIFEIKLKPPVDLEVTSVVCPDTAAGNRKAMIKYTVRNSGLSATVTSQWIDAIGMGISSSLESKFVQWIKDVEHQGNLDKNTDYTDSAYVTIPDKIRGPYFVYVNTDRKNIVYEHDLENNNFSSSAKPVIIVNPDIVVSHLSAPDTVFSGKKPTISYTKSCQGKGVVSKKHFDRIYLSQNSDGDTSGAIVLKTIAAEEILNPGDSILYTEQVVLPNGIEGPYYLFVYADVGNHEYENVHEDNNRSEIIPLQVKLSPPVDLSTVSIEVNDTIIYGKNNTIKYQVANLSDADIHSVSWTDDLYLSEHEFLASENTFLLKSVTIKDTLLADSSYTRNLTTGLSAKIRSGYYYLVLKTDASDNVYEHLAEDNNRLVLDSIFVEGYPPVDLKADYFEAPLTARTGEKIPVSYTVKNVSDDNTVVES